MAAVTKVSATWLDQLPPFVSADTVARIFDVDRKRAVRWMGAEDSPLPRAKRPDNLYVTAREHVVALAVRLYGDMGHQVDRQRSYHDEVPGSAELERRAGDGLD